MKKTADYRLDISTRKTEPGSYEWWYFDGRDYNGEYQFVVIFYEGCPFSSKYMRQQKRYPDHESAKAARYPAVSISIYKNGKPIYYSMSEYASTDSDFNRDEVKLRIGKNTMEALVEHDQLVYALRLEETLPGGDRISAMLRFVSPMPNCSIWEQADDNHKAEIAVGHSWNLVQPSARVKGMISISTVTKNEKPIIFDGVGYHDHNLGFEPMKNEFRDWYWGRAHFDDFSLVYYVMNTVNGRNYGAWLFTPDNQSIIASASEVRIDGANMNAFGLNSCRRIEFNFTAFSIMVYMRNLIDNGPFYQRFKCEAIVKHGENEPLQEAAYGISEYIKPSRIHSRIFWPLVHMRYRYAFEKPHWVQKSPFLYRWTW
jgi:carotenoid 1,2-hydratase